MDVSLFRSLPRDISVLIIEFLDYNDLVIVSQVSKDLHAISHSDTAWKFAYWKKWNHKGCPIRYYTEEVPKKLQTWRNFFITRIYIQRIFLSSRRMIDKLLREESESDMDEEEEEDEEDKEEEGATVANTMQSLSIAKQDRRAKQTEIRGATYESWANLMVKAAFAFDYRRAKIKQAELRKFEAKRVELVKELQRTEPSQSKIFEQLLKLENFPKEPEAADRYEPDIIDEDDNRSEAAILEWMEKKLKEIPTLPQGIDSELLFALSYEFFESALITTFMQLDEQTRKTLSTDPKPFSYSNFLINCGDLYDKLKPLLQFSDLHKQLDSSILINYGRAYFNQGELTEGELSYKAFFAAIPKLALAIDIEVESITYLLLDIGDALVDIARYKSQSKAPLDRTKLDIENEGRTARKQTAIQIITCALEFYREAHNRNKSNPACLTAWAGSLFDLGEVVQELGKEIDSEKYFAEACEKYEMASKLDETDDSIRNDWGRVLYELAKVRDGAETERLLEESCKQYDVAISLSSSGLSKSVKLKNWADSLSELSLCKKDAAEVDKIYEQVIAKYREALEDSDDRSTILNNWGSACYDQAKMKQEKSEIQQLLQEAADRYLEGLAIKSDDETILFNYGDVLAEQAKIQESESTEEKMDELFVFAHAKYATSSVDSITLNNWGFALYEHAMCKKGETKLKLLNESESKYKESLLLDSSYYTSTANIGNIYREKAKLCTDPVERDALFAVAIEKYKDSLRIHGSHVKAYVYWAQLLIEQSQMMKRDGKGDDIMQSVVKKLHEAKEKCASALKIKPNYHLAAFTLAEVYAFLGQDSLKDQWLDTLKKWTNYKTDWYRYRHLSVRTSFSKLCGEC